MIKRAIQSALGAFGYHLTRVNNGAAPVNAPSAEVPSSWSLNHFFPLLQGLGFDPKHIVDIGANTGLWTRAAIRYFPRAHYTLVEPQNDLKVHIQDLVDGGYQLHWINAGASDTPGELPLYVQGRNDSSTFRQVSTSLRQIPVRLRTLNEIVASSGLPTPEMVKIDAEGLDLKVLAGASDLFGKTEIFLAEAAIVAPRFDNTAGALIGAMDDAGYRLIDITDINRSPQFGVLWLCELAFLRKSSLLLDAATHYSADLTI